MNYQTGGLIDQRTEDQKSHDYLHEEIARGVDTVTWETKTSYKEYYPYNQSTSLSCVAGGGAITEEHFSNKSFIPSRKDIYIRRFNRPAGGMTMPDLFNICIKGIAGEDRVSSQGLSETPMNTEYPITNDIVVDRSVHSFKAWVSIKNFQDENTLASIVDHTPIVAFWFFEGGDWWKQYPSVDNKNLSLFSPTALHHQAAIIDRTVINGKHYFVIQDTAGVGTGAGNNGNLRYVDMEFIKARLYSAGYGINNEPVDIQKPKVLLFKSLSVGTKGSDVVDLQKVLIYEKLLPIKEPTGLFGGFTRKAVMAYQVKYRKEILDPIGLNLPTGVVASRTIAHINNLYK